MHSDDHEVWSYARDHGFTLLTKDRDFQQIVALRGIPPKIVWLRVGNSSTARITDVIVANIETIRQFGRDDRLALLVLAASQ